MDRKIELQALNCDKWAINGAWKWCRDNGVGADFYTVDPQPFAAELARGSDSGIVASWCAPELFDEVRGKRFRIFHCGDERFCSGPSSATAALTLSAFMGYEHISFYGCRSCLPIGRTSHAYQNQEYQDVLLVETAQGSFYTTPALILQAETLAAAIREFPEQFSDCSGGLLGALVHDPEWEATAMTPSLAELVGAELA